MDFKIPQSIPQDLLLISEFIDQPQINNNIVPNKNSVNSTDDDDDASSSSDTASEEEIASSLLPASTSTSPLLPGQPPAPADSSDDDDTSSSDSDTSSSDDEPEKKSAALQDVADDDDEDPVPAASSATYFQTKHEISEAEAPVVVPEIETVGEDEVLEKVGQILNIMGNVVIIHGVPSSDISRGSEKALDSDTLLVFDDRKVLGYIYETFGPTSQPLYQVKFNSTTFPLNPEIVIPGRDVFHVPARSKFVFVNQIKAFKGSDASNVHDEEVGDDEIEFSDDEQEAEHKSRIKRKRADSRARSQAGSRQSTPNPTLMRDQELNGAGIAEEFLSRNAYDEHGPYDIDYTAPGPSSSSTGARPLPGPYDDPYGDAYTAGNVRSMNVDQESQPQQRREERRGGTGGEQYGQQRQAQQGGRGSGRDRGRDRGRGRGKDRERHHHPHGVHGHGPTERGRGRGGGQMHQRQNYSDPYPAQNHNQGATDSGHHPHQHQQIQQGAYGVPPHTGGGGWGYNQPSPQGYDYTAGYNPQPQGQVPQGQYPFVPMQNPMGMGFPPGMGGMNMGMGMPGMGMQNFPVQPHINPRFAGAFGIPMGYPGAAAPGAVSPPIGGPNGMDMNVSAMPSQVSTPIQTHLYHQHQGHSQPQTLPQNSFQPLLGQNVNQNQNQNQQQLSFDVDSLLKSVAAAAAASQGSSGAGFSGEGSGGQA